MGNRSVCLGKENQVVSNDLGPTRVNGDSPEKCLALSCKGCLVSILEVFGFEFKECPMSILEVEPKLSSSELPLCFDNGNAMTNFSPGNLHVVSNRAIACYEGDGTGSSLGVGEKCGGSSTGKDRSVLSDEKNW
ncbi:unnamed protein product [Ilex paraguariensis]|uniref:Uncharacterized protein n=1 Tax=Ilex paraguariensis TaxID=185542 RepID=A0ABC8TS65_9AQUA